MFKPHFFPPSGLQGTRLCYSKPYIKVASGSFIFLSCLDNPGGGPSSCSLVNSRGKGSHTQLHLPGGQRALPQSHFPRCWPPPASPSPQQVESLLADRARDKPLQSNGLPFASCQGCSSQGVRLNKNQVHRHNSNTFARVWDSRTIIRQLHFGGWMGVFLNSCRQYYRERFFFLKGYLGQIRANTGVNPDVSG